MQNYNPTSTWQYISVTYSNLPASTDNVQIKIYMGSTSHDLDNGDTIDISIAAAQLEKGSFATSYIPTTTTTATRNADVVTVPTSNWSASAGTIFAVANDPSSTDKRQVLNWYKDTNNEYSLQRYQGSYGTPGFQVWESPTNLSGAVTKSLAGYSTIAGTYLNNGPITAYLNGSPGTPTANMTTINGLASTASIGSHSTGVQYYNGSIQRLTVYNSALSSGDVSTVTSAIQNGP